MKKITRFILISILISSVSLSDSLTQTPIVALSQSSVNSSSSNIPTQPITAEKKLPTLPLTIYYEDNVYKLSQYQKGYLKNFALSYKKSKQKKKFYITGYADRSDTIGKQYSMSENRAIAVRNFLKTCGIPTYYMQVYYLGSSVVNSTSNGSLNRRTTLTYSKPYTPIKTTTIHPNNSYNFINIK